MKKFSLSLLAIFVLSPFPFLGTNHLEDQLTSFFNVITAWVTINPLEANVSAPSEVEINKVFKVTVEVVNKGEEKIKDAQGEIFLSEGLVLLKKNSVQEIGVISGKKKKKIHWRLKGEKEGHYIITVKVSGELKGSELTKEVSVKVLVKEKSVGVKERGTSFFRRFLDFLSELIF